MTLFQKIKSWRPDGRLILAAAALAMAALLVPNTSHADLLGIGNIASGAIAWVVFYIEYFMATIAGVLIALIVYFVGVLLTLNTQIVNDFTVQTGFGVTLSIANLAFILGIIIIAISTILRSSSYGMKQILWKLIVAAILVNFSLVICAPIIGFADELTSYFLTSVPGGGSGVNGFAQALAGAFTPQKAFLGLTSDGNNLGTTVNGKTIQGNSGSTFANMLTPLISVVFVAGFLVIIVVVLAIFMVQLLMRYIWLSLLLILMPLAWLGWVFPAFSGSWHKWWHHFIRWTFFAPLVTFFIWLAIVTSSQLGQLPALTGAAGNPVISGISSNIGNFVADMAQSIIQMILVAGLAVGGMMAANSMGITAAGTAVNAAKGTGNYFKEKAKKGGRLAYQGADKGVANLSQRAGGSGLGITQRLQQGKIGGLQYIPGVGKLAQKGATYVGGKVKQAQTNEDLVAAAAKTVPHSSEDIKAELQGGLSLEKQFAYIAELMKQGKLDKKTMVGNQSIADFMDSHNAAVDRYGQGKLRKDVDKTLGSNYDMRKEEKKILKPATEVMDEIKNYEKEKKDLERQGKPTDNVDKELAKAEDRLAEVLKPLHEVTRKYYGQGGLEAADIRKMQANTALSPESPMSVAIARAIPEVNPSFLPVLLQKTTGESKTTFRKTAKRQLDHVEKTYKQRIADELGLPIDSPQVEKRFAEDYENIVLTKKNFRRILDNQIAYSGGGGDSGGSGATPAP